MKLSADLEKSEPKVSNWSEFHFFSVTIYKTHILTGPIRSIFLQTMVPEYKPECSREATVFSRVPC